MQISSSFASPFNSTQKLFLSNEVSNGFLVNRVEPWKKICAVSPNVSFSCAASSVKYSAWIFKSYQRCCFQSTYYRQVKIHRRRSSLESLFCYNKPIPEERIGKPVGLSLVEKVIEDNPQCTIRKAKGAVLCTTCSGLGLYVDSILESQGIIVKVCCLGCGQNR